jgi:energy-coupling factor transporter ATP-binding protein EcfA2
MSVYKEIIEWSGNKPLFIRDALKRILNNGCNSVTDIDQLVLLLKKEVGFTGIAISANPIALIDIPVQAIQGSKNTRLASIEDPINISALYNKAKLNFPTVGLTIAYGNNGSGKSSYARLLKKLCWSRHKNVELKKNVYTQDTSIQGVKITFDNGGTQTTFQWSETKSTHPNLNSILVFDSNCGNIYVNNENPTEYKPVGIDLLETLITVCNQIDQNLSTEIGSLTCIKPQLDPIKFTKTNWFFWHSKVESYELTHINSKLVFTKEHQQRKEELRLLLKTNDPIEDNKNLQQKIQRFETAKKAIVNIEVMLSASNVDLIKTIKADYQTKQGAYILAQQNIKGEDPLKGVGSESWRLLWEAARRFAISEVHPAIDSFPAAESAETCVLCQQPLTTDALLRMERFNTFIHDTTSNDFIRAQANLNIKINEIRTLSLSITDTFSEIQTDLPSFEQSLEEFTATLKLIKNELINFLEGPDKTDFTTLLALPIISEIIKKQIEKLNSAISSNSLLAINRTQYENELLELEALELLTSLKTDIVSYYNENQKKYWLNQCRSKLNTGTISKKIGDIMESEAITLQHAEFIKHLNSLDQEIASKVEIKKTKTSSGSTYQKCSFINIKEALNTVLSEGELKIVALANFFSECTIDNATNTVVFDDPVTSLDQNYRETIAKIIIGLSKNRQVIILTHDLFFLRLLMDTHKEELNSHCTIIGLTKRNNVTGIVSDEIPYLVKNVQERIDSIRKVLAKIQWADSSDRFTIDNLVESARKRFRMLLEKSVEEVLASKAIERFSRNIKVKSGVLSSFVIVEHIDIQFILTLFGKYSTTEHDGSLYTVPQLPDEVEIEHDLRDFSSWKDGFNDRVSAFKKVNSYQ